MAAPTVGNADIIELAAWRLTSVAVIVTPDASVCPTTDPSACVCRWIASVATRTRRELRCASASVRAVAE
ncbi:MAG: hypothetical protein R3E48_02025 [Burkholderiaceae bacterium]